MIELKEKKGFFTMKNTIGENLLNNLSMDKTIGDNIKQFRKDKGLSQKELGKKIGVSQQKRAKITNTCQNCNRVRYSDSLFTFKL